MYKVHLYIIMVYRDGKIIGICPCALITTNGMVSGYCTIFEIFMPLYYYITIMTMKGL